MAVILGAGGRDFVPRAGEAGSLDFVTRKSPPAVIQRAPMCPYARRTMNITNLPKLTIGVIAIGALVACGQPPAGQSETPAQVWHELVVCARTHGDPMLPDPTVDSQGMAHWPPGTPEPSTDTIAACQSIYNRLPASVRNGGAPDIQTAIKFAQCMRAHGLTDWPDPQPDGFYRLPPDLQSNSKSGPVWDRIKAGWDACAQYNPSGHISVTQ